MIRDHMGFSKDPVKRRRQLEALARSNPRIDIDALLAKHELSEPSAVPPQPAPGPHDAPDLHDAPAPASEHSEASGILWRTRAEEADVEVDDEDGLTVLLWGAGADEEHPMLGIPITDDAALDLMRSIERIFEPERGLPSEIEVAQLRARELERGPGMIAAPVDLDMTDAEGRGITAHLTGHHGKALKKLYNVDLFGRPKPVAVDADGRKLPDIELEVGGHLGEDAEPTHAASGSGWMEDR